MDADTPAISIFGLGSYSHKSLLPSQISPRAAPHWRLIPSFDKDVPRSDISDGISTDFPGAYEHIASDLVSEESMVTGGHRFGGQSYQRLGKHRCIAVSLILIVTCLVLGLLGFAIVSMGGLGALPWPST